MAAIILICGTGDWADGVTQRLSARGQHILRARQVHEVELIIAIQPELVVLGPPFSQREMVQSYVTIRERVPACRVLVAVDRDDAAFARDLEILGVPRMVLVPSQAEAVFEEAVAFN